MQAAVHGTLSPLSALGNITDWSAVKKVSSRDNLDVQAVLRANVPQLHKLNTEPAIREASRDPAAERSVVNEIVISSVATKSVTA